MYSTYYVLQLQLQLCVCDRNKPSVSIVLVAGPGLEAAGQTARQQQLNQSVAGVLWASLTNCLLYEYWMEVSSHPLMQSAICTSAVSIQSCDASSQDALYYASGETLTLVKDGHCTCPVQGEVLCDMDAEELKVPNTLYCWGPAFLAPTCSSISA